MTRQRDERRHRVVGRTRIDSRLREFLIELMVHRADVKRIEADAEGLLDAPETETTAAPVIIVIDVRADACVFTTDRVFHDLDHPRQVSAARRDQRHISPGARIRSASGLEAFSYQRPRPGLWNLRHAQSSTLAIRAGLAHRNRIRRENEALTTVSDGCVMTCIAARRLP